LFEHEFFNVYSFENVPLTGDCYLMDETYVKEYERSLLDSFSGRNGENVGYISYVAVNKINDLSIDLSWYPNTHTRFHEVAISLPKEQFITCVGSWRYDEKPHIFVKSAWLEELHLRLYSIFCLVDADGVKEALQNGIISRPKLITLREAIDKLAERYPEVSFISFADSLLLKSNWSVGHFRSSITYTYKPEIFIEIVKELQSIYEAVLGLKIYAVLTQGGNEYYDDSLLHISDSKNHICLNSLGLPFSQLKAIEESARSAIKNKTHKPSELYMDEQFYNSLRFKFSFDKKGSITYAYQAKMMSTSGNYYCSGCQEILDNLK